MAVAGSAATVRILAPPSGASLLALVYGGVIAFNLILFFPPGTLAQSPLRTGAALLANVLPLPLAPLLYAISPALADACLILAASISVLARPLGPPLNGFALLTALNLLIPLVLGGGLELVPLGALAGVSGTAFAVMADALVTGLLWPRTRDLERWALRRELAGFSKDLSRLWPSGKISDDPGLTARIALVRRLREEVAPATGQGAATLPADLLLEGVVRCATELRGGPGTLSEATDVAVKNSLTALAEAMRSNSAGKAYQAIETLRQTSLRRPEPGEPIPPARMLGLALLLSDLIGAAMPRGDQDEIAPRTAIRQAVPWPAAIAGVQIRLALQCAVSLLLACVVMRLLPFPKPYWLALTALIVTANSFGETAAKSLERIVGTILGLLAGTFIWMAVSSAPALAAVIVLGTVFALFYERAARYRTFLFWLSLLLSLLFHLGNASDLVYVTRLADTLIGTAIAVLVTMVLLPVRTGDEARGQIVALLDLAAAKVQDIASCLASPGAHSRGGELARALDASEKLSSLTAAEGLEAVLLRRRRVGVRKRIAAAAQIIRCLLYIDQLMPLLPGTEAGVPDALRAVGAEIAWAANAVRAGAALPSLAPSAGAVRLHEAVAIAYHAGRIGLDQLQASLRLHEALAGLTRAAEELAQDAPAALAGRSQPTFTAVG
jgi:uncharacterized membrane protein YgaE (UPF0421/DUF939 family)